MPFQQFSPSWFTSGVQESSATSISGTALGGGLLERGRRAEQFCALASLAIAGSPKLLGHVGGGVGNLSFR